MKWLNAMAVKSFLSLLFIIVSITVAFSSKANGVHQESIYSKHLSEKRSVLVELPKTYQDTPNKHYPVIYLLDGRNDLQLVSGMINRLNLSDAAPEVIIVAIENTDRARDLTPTVNNNPRGPVGVGGGGDKFLDFIEFELIPYIDKQYRTHNFKILSGASIGGLLTVHALQSRPHLFQAHMAFSPAVWWGDRSTASKVKAYIANTKNVDNYLYMNIGAEAGIMREVYDEFNAFMLGNTPQGFTFKSDAFDGVPHGLTSSAGVFNAFSGLFLPLNMPIHAFEGNIDSVNAYYDRVSFQRGETVRPAENVLRELGYHFVNQGELETAITLFQINIELNPKSAAAYNGLAYGFETSGNKVDALEQVNLALKLSNKGDAGYDIFVKRRDRLMSASTKEE